MSPNPDARLSRAGKTSGQMKDVFNDNDDL